MHTATVIWECGAGDFASGRYSRGHVWRFDGGLEVAASASPSVVPLPWSIAEAVDPEEAFVASVSSCHMLWLLDLARRDGFTARRYHDHATAELVREDGRVWIPRIDLNIRVDWDIAPDPATHRALHDRAHHACFIANSIRSEVAITLLEDEQ